MRKAIVESLNQPTVAERRIEIVERKGIGHPDTICDEIMEAAALALCREYLATFGRVLHFNLDKCLLVAGRTEPRLGGGRLIEPMRLVYGDRATAIAGGRHVDCGTVVEAAGRDWLRRHLRFVNPERDVVFQNELKQGSLELADIFARGTIGANDTSVAVGYAPLSETEQLVLRCAEEVNSPSFQQRFPEAGEDVKVMGYRRDRELLLTIALAFVDRSVPSAKRYFERKHEMIAALEKTVAERLRELDSVRVVMNTLDDPERGVGGMYLTVLGTSAEGGDGGEVGRGNKVNGLISLNRPLGTEAAAGKNPVSHVGKIYSVLSERLAAEIHATVPGVREVCVWLGSQIGEPLSEPAIAAAQVILEPGCTLREVDMLIQAVIERELGAIDEFTGRLIRGEFPVA